MAHVKSAVRVLKNLRKKITAKRNLCTQQTAAIRLTPVLAHHDGQCLKRCDEEENQVEQDERIRVKGFRSYDLKLSLRFY